MRRVSEQFQFLNRHDAEDYERHLERRFPNPVYDRRTFIDATTRGFILTCERWNSAD